MPCQGSLLSQASPDPKGLCGNEERRAEGLEVSVPVKYPVVSGFICACQTAVLRPSFGGCSVSQSISHVLVTWPEEMVGLGWPSLLGLLMAAALFASP